MRLNKEQLAQIELEYPNKDTAQLAMELGICIRAVYRAAYRCNIKKSPEYIANWKVNSGISIAKAGQKTQFKLGSEPNNKGQKMPEKAKQKCAATMFKSGNVPHNTQPIGYERFDKDGYIEIKTQQGFMPKHRWIWACNFGDIPNGHIIVFKNGDKHDLSIENLECISRVENVNRNRFSYAPEYKECIKLLKQLKKAIRDAKKQH